MKTKPLPRRGIGMGQKNEPNELVHTLHGEVLCLRIISLRTIQRMIAQNA